MRYGIGCNIVDVANQLSFTYRGLAPELQVFVSPPTKSTKASDFIRTLKEKQEVWYEMLTMPVALGQNYENFRQLFPFRPLLTKPSLFSQSDAFLCHQAQQTFRALSQHSPQQPWRASNRPLDVNANGPWHQYPPQPFKQTFMSQRQYYPTNNQRYQQPSLPAGANCNTALRGGQITQSTLRTPGNATNRPQTAPYQAIPRQPYQSGQSQHVY